jgi:hypothetical protein
MHFRTLRSSAQRNLASRERAGNKVGIDISGVGWNTQAIFLLASRAMTAMSRQNWKPDSLTYNDMRECTAHSRPQPMSNFC